MYNKQFKLDVESVTPFAGKEGEETKAHGCTITGILQTANIDFFTDDLAFAPGKVSRVDPLLHGKFPVAAPFDLEFTPRKIITFEYDTIAEPCELKGIQILESDDDVIKAKIKIKLPNAKQKTLGVLCESLRETIKVKLVAKQETLALEEKEKEPAKGKQEALPLDDKGEEKEK